jgi:hypothetical protein
LKHSFGKRDGRLYQHDIPHIWVEFPSDIHAILMDLLERFEIVFRLPDKVEKERTFTSEDIAASFSPLVSEEQQYSSNSDISLALSPSYSFADLLEAPTIGTYLVPSLLPDQQPPGVCYTRQRNSQNACK